MKCKFLSGIVIATILSFSAHGNTYSSLDTTDQPNIIFFLIDDLGMISTPQYGAQGDYTSYTDGDVPYVKNTDGSYSYQSSYSSYYPPNSTNNRVSPTPVNGKLVPQLGGSTSITPNMDKIADGAMMFTHAYSTPSCAPSRAELMSGLYPFASKIVYPGYGNNTYLGANDSQDSPSSMQANTWTSLLHDQGYTNAFGGKWNLRWGVTIGYEGYSNWNSMNTAQLEHLRDCGFEYPWMYPFIGNTVDYRPPVFAPSLLTNQVATPNTGNSVETGYYPYELGLFAQDFLNLIVDYDTYSAKLNTSELYPPPNTALPRSLAPRSSLPSVPTAPLSTQYNAPSEPFVLHYCFGSIHDYGGTPTPEYPTQTSENELFVNRLKYVDEQIGKVLAILDQYPDVKENTVIIVAGDNGTEYNCGGHHYSNMVPIKALVDPTVSQSEGKELSDVNLVVHGEKCEFNTWGSRVPLMFYWPGQIDAGWSSQIVDFSDVHATLVEAGKGSQDINYNTYGASFWTPLMTGDWSTFNRDVTYSQMQETWFVANQNYQIRMGPGTTAGLYQINTYSNSGDSIITNPFSDGTPIAPPTGGWNALLPSSGTNACDNLAADDAQANYNCLYQYYMNTPQVVNNQYQTLGQPMGALTGYPFSTNKQSYND